ncbi:MAG: 30S ribosomal protein S8 [Limisphaerales bacterium]|nr:30S ribosomal protein S8 [Pedosphaera sp.]MBL6843975.1 30S ribosomal protein S8 [Verrucomicrobiae bacterium]HAQ98067.1 30S ribosomal protein S8 [Verrucomicrobiales bacterium]HBP56159.1 30S ribosomal protein S8 [Verrucomicrobiales bacterium]HCP39561.1 30S ribosomal protein S8 [Verrucomicrobiales bacterium]|tara:strand:- start:1035 stop:1418 length:384 start_codon:yes stop_codon:yes gene_type:complete
MDPIADMLTILRNANAALLPQVELRHSKVKESIADILKKEGFITDYQVSGDNIKKLQIALKYNGRVGVFAGLKKVSKPGLRRYVGSGEVPKVLGGMGISIVSTSRGLMTGTQARRDNVGGELLCYVW